MIFVVITVKITQGVYLVLPFIFYIVPSIFHTHSHAAVISITVGEGRKPSNETKRLSVNG